MDNLARCAMLAKRDGVSYGHWMAIHGEKEIKKKEQPIPKGLKRCMWCKELFCGKPNQTFCSPSCRYESYWANNEEKKFERNRKAKERYHERKKLKNESCC